MVTWIKNILHWFAHLIGRNHGRIVSFQEVDKIIVGFKCDTCQKVESISDITDFYKEKVKI